MTAGPVRRRGDVLGFGLAVALFLPGAACLGSTNGHRFIENRFFAFTYYLAGIGFAAVLLLAWRRGGGRYADPGFGRSAWSPWLFKTGQGVAYGSNRTDTGVVLALVRSAFIFAGVVAMYYLGHVL
ncbi:hypothetical protein ACF08M_29225 [Streptomyces sp. NPDC015032]|uniref:hypothetical protein n=1 Tax=Streptomyces sp. NPDC015032 TaxID=3364937 RepID=UPI0036FDA947